MRERGGIGGEGKDDEGMEKKENDEIKKRTLLSSTELPKARTNTQDT